MFKNRIDVLFLNLSQPEAVGWKQVFMSPRGTIVVAASARSPHSSRGDAGGVLWLIGHGAET
jgi:hypothetical protein